MSESYPLPDPEKVKQTVARLRQARLGLAEANLKLAEIGALLEADLRQQKLNRLQKSRP